MTRRAHRLPKCGRHTPYIVLIDWPFFGYRESRAMPRRQNRRDRHRARREVKP